MFIDDIVLLAGIFGEIEQKIVAAATVKFPIAINPSTRAGPFFGSRVIAARRVKISFVYNFPILFASLLEFIKLLYYTVTVHEVAVNVVMPEAERLGALLHFSSVDQRGNTDTVKGAIVGNLRAGKFEECRQDINGA